MHLPTRARVVWLKWLPWLTGLFILTAVLRRVAPGAAQLAVIPLAGSWLATGFWGFVEGWRVRDLLMERAPEVLAREWIGPIFLPSTNFQLMLVGRDPEARADAEVMEHVARLRALTFGALGLFVVMVPVSIVIGG